MQNWYSMVVSYLFLILAFVINAAGSILLKIDAGTVPLHADGPLAFLMTHRFLLGGLIAFALNVIFYWLALRNLPLSVAYPVMLAGTFLIVNGYAALILHESVSLAQIAGYVLIFSGVLFVLLGK